MNVESLLAVGKEWKKDDFHRIYFSDINELAGLNITRYNTGNISSASLRGIGSISNSEARRIQSTSFSKLWYDVKTGEFGRRDLSQTLFDLAVAELKKIGGEQ